MCYFNFLRPDGQLQAPDKVSDGCGKFQQEEQKEQEQEKQEQIRLNKRVEQTNRKEQ